MGDLGLIPGLEKIPWRRERLPTPVSWPGEFHGLYSQWGRKESDITSDFHFTSGGLGKAKGSYHIYKGPQSICGVWLGLDLEDTSRENGREMQKV